MALAPKNCQFYKLSASVKLQPKPSVKFRLKVYVNNILLSVRGGASENGALWNRYTGTRNGNEWTPLIRYRKVFEMTVKFTEKYGQTLHPPRKDLLSSISYKITPTKPEHHYQKLLKMTVSIIGKWALLCHVVSLEVIVNYQNGQSRFSFFRFVKFVNFIIFEHIQV